MRKLARVPETAQMLDLSAKKVWAMVAAREIETVRIGRSVRIPLEAIEKLILENTTPARVA
jgi:excisionase family DNA binding protein